ncbi:MAG: CRISPR-associated endonuclease Cas1 [Candidatus Viridilinea halotolerans]|uniref:CRISPR-associated endonuclease Cas1 n=1 Tax=Candidatus Viridilinea halotolerans TaxID=2491704 RepID=A0A426UBV6_9CHLR|nr:MAG: CRISPR-associated endonuclease Cas1 [Candidatus Viridilinea halotolerans]
MPTLYVIEQGAVLACDGERIEVRREDAVLGSIPLIKLDDIVVFGNVGLSTPAIKRLLDRGIEVVFLTTDGRYHGRLVGEVTAHVALRQAQYARAADAAWALDQAQRFVAGKIRNQRAVLHRFTRNRSNPPAEAERAAAELDYELQRVGRTTKINALMGLEGSATARYFRGFRALIGDEWQFTSRQRRPPPDPINVLLSLGYTLLTHKAHGAVQAAGFDPYLGFLHQVEYNRPSLALDLIEEFRPILVDSLVLRVCGDGRVTTSDFSPGDAARPVIFGDEGKRRFLSAFEERMRTVATHPLGSDSGPGKVSYLRCIELQARRLARAIREKEQPYEAFTAR